MIPRHGTCGQGRRRSIVMWVKVAITKQYKWSTISHHEIRLTEMLQDGYLWSNEQNSSSVSIEQSKKKNKANSNSNMAPNGASPSCRQDDQIKMNPDYSLTLEETMTPHVGISRVRYREHRLAPHRMAHNTRATDRPAGPVLLLWGHVCHICLLYLFRL